MNGDNKWIKLHSKILNWEWYKNSNTKSLFIHCLLKANWKAARFEGLEIKRGSFVTSYQKLANELGISKQEVRTALKHLNLTQEITQSQHRKFTVITVLNYEMYQQNNTISNTELTLNQHSTNTELTTIEEYKNIDDIEISICSYVEENYARTISSIEYEKIRSWCQEFDEELIKYAIELSVLNYKKTFQYVQGILNNWKGLGYKTKNDVLDNERKKETQKEPVELFDYDWLEEGMNNES